jgi:dGTPase
MRTRVELEELEDRRLAPWAQRSSESGGRFHLEPRHPYRTEFERDRSRIVHSRAFRRLECKTQVFLSGTGDHLRTRLTHTMEVASISRTIARGLGLNEDLTEAIALAHDLGHPPFGHSGERTLDVLMKGHGGFDHNEQSLRIVEVIEQKYPRFSGLNLSWDVREGLCKHERFHLRPADGSRSEESFPSPSLEAQVADLADEITYYSHDLDDGLEFALLNSAELSGLEAWDQSLRQVAVDFPSIQGRERDNYVIRCMIDRQVQDVMMHSAGVLAEVALASADEARRCGRRIIGYSPGLKQANRELRKFLYQRLYQHPSVAEVNQAACEMLSRVFIEYLEKPELLGVCTARRLESDGLHRTVCDYLSGMTDRYLQEEYRKISKG